MKCFMDDPLMSNTFMYLGVRSSFTIKDHLGKFDERADDGFFLGYSMASKAFIMFSCKKT